MPPDSRAAGVPGNAAPIPPARLWPIRVQLAALVLAIAVPVTALLVYLLADAARTARENAFRQVEQMASSVSVRLNFVIRDAASHLEHFARREAEESLDPQACADALATVVHSNPLYDSAELRDRNGRVICSAGDLDSAPEEEATRDSLREDPRARGLKASGAFQRSRDKRWMTMLTYRLPGENGKATGRIRLALDVGVLRARLLENLPLDTLVAVVDTRDRYLLRSVDHARWVGKVLPPTTRANLARREPWKAYEANDAEGVRRLLVMGRVPATGWRVIAGVSEQSVMAGPREQFRVITILGLVTLAAALAVSYAIGSAIALQVSRLANLATAAARDSPPPSTPTGGSAELAAVAAELRRLAGERSRQQQQMRGIVSDYEKLLRSARDAYVLVDERRRIVDFNDATVEAYGYSREELAGKPMIELRAPEARESFARDWAGAADPGGCLFETVHQRRDGTRIPVEVSLRTVATGGGAPYWQAFLRDITARKATEETLRRQNEELQRFNRAAVGRELDLVALKRRVNELSRELGRPPPYPLEFLARRGERDEPGDRA